MAISASVAATLMSTALTVDCARMCILGGSAVHMECLVSRLTGMPCDTGLLIMLVVATMIGIAFTLLLWAWKITRVGSPLDPPAIDRHFAGLPTEGD